MLLWLRHLLAIALLPFTVTILVPLWIARAFAVRPALGDTALALILQSTGFVVLLAGLALFSASLLRFATEGKGTLAPWDPPRALVVRGPYRYVRNPMISGVILVLVAESLLLRSLPHALWTAIFLAVNLVHIPLYEEPRLRRRFGQSYVDYCRHVPRLLPRLRPWTPARIGRPDGPAG